ncbi:hypothetical protein SAMN07250955_111107 [Arboricoccus pini]|uniref:Uncharacterized protein n=1 Tax=Arboricoccus pini TaxID=1963835 RepID=A0A212RP65_9PROT|nr:hypothetical protein SAMN07250955_111107 [Arboricoccus pini]
MSIAWEQVASHARAAGVSGRRLRSIRWPVVAGVAFAISTSVLGWVAIWQILHQILLAMSS